MSPQPARLTDRVALNRNRSRALKSGATLFAHSEALATVKERLSTVNRAFTAPAVITGFPGFWSQSFPKATIVSDEETLLLEPGAHDLVISALVLHWANDPVGHLVQCRRALTPDGLFLGVGFGGRTLQELRASLASAESKLRDGLSPRVVPMGEIRDLGGLLQRAGFALPVADSLPLSAHYRDMRHLMHDLRAMGETNALDARDRKFTGRALFDEAANLYASQFPAPENRITATFDLIALTGWAPGPDQPRPLRPGSATTRLSDALGTEEFTLPKRGVD